jgi:hypothetical protein
MGTIFWNMSSVEYLPFTGMHANEVGQQMKFVDAFMHNMGLCMSPGLMDM